MSEIWEKGRNLIQETLELARRGETEHALNLLDDVVNEAIEEDRGTWVPILCKHGAIIAQAEGDRARQISYEESALPYVPDYRFAAYNLALLLLNDGQVARAERYASEAHKLSITSEAEDDRNLVAAIRLQWPRAAENE